ncbi:MAG: DUF2330 domain-containing protein [Synechococcaceae cyanobacterium RL_1_2]|nr:DUF2330 domain-containing protein [Synechococcaceae cyanobacterium RL_1_2]
MGLTFLLSFTLMKPVWAFCGFYLAKADTKLYNETSQVILARDGDRTVITMANDFEGDVNDFALVVPVPTIIQEDQVNVGDLNILTRLDDFSAPRLVEYFDPDPCAMQIYEQELGRLSSDGAAPAPAPMAKNEAYGVTIEESFSVGEYDILILSAKESNGLINWLNDNDYKIPTGANEIVSSYLKNGMKFFVAKVNLEEFDRGEFQKLRPLQIAYESSKLMLPIRLGMVNAKGDQDLILYLLSPNGQVELTNYRTVRIPTDANVPEFVQEEFGDFYSTMFAKDYQANDRNVAFLEYAWDMASCDPCSAPILTPEELRQAGVFWNNEQISGNPWERPTSNTFLTRLHVRYSRDRFPADLQFQETSNQQYFQGRYVINRPFRSEPSDNSKECREAMNSYRQSTRDRQSKEAQTVAKLTGWNLEDINQKIDYLDDKPIPWWRRLWSFHWK